MRRSGVGLPTSAAFGAGLLLWAARLGTDPLHDNSFLTHLATGRRILDSGVPSADPYSFTAPGEPWVVQSWLASVVYAQTDAWFGGSGLRLLLAALLALLVAGVWRLTAPARSLVPRILIGGLAVAAGSGAWSFERPLLFGLLGVVALLLILQGDLPAWSAVPVLWIWVNTHGSFPLGLVLLVAVGIGKLADREDLALTRRTFGFAVLGTVLGALNPIGPRLLVFPVELLGRRAILRNVVEWQAATFEDGWMLAYLVLLVVTIVALVRRPTWTAAVPVVVFVPMSLLAMRNIAVAVIVLVPSAAIGLRDLGALRGDEPSRRVALGVGLLVALTVAVAVVRIDGSAAMDLRGYPVDAVAHLDDRGAVGDGDDTRIVTHDYAGNLLEFLDMGEPVFFDDRFDMYPAELNADYLVLMSGGITWNDVLERHDAMYVLWHRGLALESLLLGDSRWQQVWADDTFRAWCRRGVAPDC